MSKSVRKKRSTAPGSRGGRPRRTLARPNPQSVEPERLPLSLPPGVTDGDTTSLAIPVVDDSEGWNGEGPRPFWWAPEDSKIKRAAVEILMMRAAGISDEEISKITGLTQGTIRTYVYRAAKNGWLKNFTSAREEIETSVAAKVVRNIHAMLDDNTEPETQKEVTLEVFKGTLAKGFDQVAAAPVANQNVLAIKMEFAPGAPNVTIREGTTGGNPAWIDGELAGKG